MLEDARAPQDQLKGIIAKRTENQLIIAFTGLAGSTPVSF
jgi:hypothetical protein